MPIAAVTAASLSIKDRRILVAVGTGTAALSLGGSSFIVLCYLLFKELRKFSFKLVFFLALSDMFCSFFSIIGDPSNGIFCYAQDYSTHFFCVASFLWTTTIAFTLHRTVVKHKTDVEDFGSVFHLYVWGTSLAMTVMRSIGSDYGRSGAWCWTETGHAGQMAVGMSDRSHQFDTGADKKALNRWGYYPLILIGSWAFATINRIYDFINPGHRIFWLSFADVWFAGLMGLFNSIAYGLNSSVRQAITERFETYVPERFKRWVPSKLRGQRQENELISLIVEGQN